jgi:hypothetical protein
MPSKSFAELRKKTQAASEKQDASAAAAAPAAKPASKFARLRKGATPAPEPEPEPSEAEETPASAKPPAEPGSTPMKLSDYADGRIIEYLIGKGYIVAKVCA